MDISWSFSSCECHLLPSVSVFSSKVSNNYGDSEYILTLFCHSRFYGFILMAIYTVFVVIAVLAEVDVLPTNF